MSKIISLNDFIEQIEQCEIDYLSNLFIYEFRAFREVFPWSYVWKMSNSEWDDYWMKHQQWGTHQKHENRVSSAIDQVSIKMFCEGVGRLRCVFCLIAHLVYIRISSTWAGGRRYEAKAKESTVWIQWCVWCSHWVHNLFLTLFLGCEDDGHCQEILFILSHKHVNGFYLYSLPQCTSPVSCLSF